MYPMERKPLSTRLAQIGHAWLPEAGRAAKARQEWMLQVLARATSDDRHKVARFFDEIVSVVLGRL